MRIEEIPRVRRWGCRESLVKTVDEVKNERTVERTAGRTRKLAKKMRRLATEERLA
jgi:hypothetical protein